MSRLDFRRCCVITSYSIHYTKLYDAFLAAVLGTLRGQRLDLVRELVGGGRAGLSRGSGRLGRMLVISQISVAVVLLVGAALFARSLQELASVPMGFQSENVTAFTLSPVKTLYPDRASRNNFV